MALSIVRNRSRLYNNWLLYNYWRLITSNLISDYAANDSRSDPTVIGTWIVSVMVIISESWLCHC